MTAKSALDRIATIAVIVAAGAVIWTVGDRYFGRYWRKAPVRASSTIPIPNEPVVLGASWVEGRADSSGVVMMFSDFQCPYCARFAREILPTLEAEYVSTGRLKIAFRHLPLEQIHPFALPAAVAANCAGHQGHFWEFHNAIFKTQDQLSSMSFPALARELGLKSPEFESCLAENRSDEIQTDQRLAAQLSVRGTPAFFVGLAVGQKSVQVRKVLNGLQTVQDFRNAIDSVLSRVE